MKKGFVIAGFAGLVCGAVGYLLYRKHKKTYVEMPPRKDDEEIPVGPETENDPPISIVWGQYKGEQEQTGDIPEDTEDSLSEKPYRIEKEEYNTKFNECEALTYYADGILTDDTNDIVVDAVTLVGDIAQFFEDEDTDVVYMRNDFLGFDYEIVRDPRSYLSIVGKNPYLVGGKLDDEVDEE